MELKKEIIQLDGIQIHLLHFNEFDPELYLDKLSETERSRLHTFTHINRRREYMCTRILKRELFGEKKIDYDNNGAPSIKEEGFISISHSANYCAIAICHDFKIGLDLEERSPKAARLNSKFINDHEHTFLDSANELEMTSAWSCKETLYKLSGRKKILFKKHLLLTNKVGDEWWCEIINPSEKIFVKLKTIITNDLVITINTSPIETVALF